MHSPLSVWWEFRQLSTTQLEKDSSVQFTWRHKVRQVYTLPMVCKVSMLFSLTPLPSSWLWNRDSYKWAFPGWNSKCWVDLCILCGVPVTPRLNMFGSFASRGIWSKWSELRWLIVWHHMVVRNILPETNQQMYCCVCNHTWYGHTCPGKAVSNLSLSLVETSILPSCLFKTVKT